MPRGYTPSFDHMHALLPQTAGSPLDTAMSQQRLAAYHGAAPTSGVHQSSGGYAPQACTADCATHGRTMSSACAQACPRHAPRAGQAPPRPGPRGRESYFLRQAPASFRTTVGEQVPAPWSGFDSRQCHEVCMAQAAGDPWAMQICAHGCAQTYPDPSDLASRTGPRTLPHKVAGSPGWGITQWPYWPRPPVYHY